MLNEFLFTKIEEEDIRNIWFQQNGNTCHTGEATLDALRPVFEDHIISRRADVVWPARSCELTLLDYYLWSAVKDKCYAGKLETIDALKDNIREAIGHTAIQLHTIDNVFKNVFKRPTKFFLSNDETFAEEIFSNEIMKPKRSLFRRNIMFEVSATD